MKKGRNKLQHDNVLGNIRIPGVISGAVTNHVTDADKEGEVYINVSKRSTVKAGPCFHPGFRNRFSSILGDMASISEFTAKLLYKDYEPRGSKADLPFIDHVLEAKRAGLKQSDVPNAAAIIAEAIWTRVETLSKTAKEVAYNTLKERSWTWTSFRKRKVPRVGLFVNTSNVNDVIVTYDANMRYYLAILADINTAVATHDDPVEQRLAVYDVVDSLIVDRSVGFYAGVESLPEELQQTPMMDKATFEENVRRALSESEPVEVNDDNIGNVVEEEEKPKAKKKKATKKKSSKKKTTVKAASGSEIDEEHISDEDKALREAEREEFLKKEKQEAEAESNEDEGSKESDVAPSVDAMSAVETPDAETATKEDAA